jgi:diaminopropionate ammonia-lyase
MVDGSPAPTGEERFLYAAGPGPAAASAGACPQQRPAGASSPGELRRFHAALPGYDPTPLVSVPKLADALGAASVHIKLETLRLGLPSFKIMGASWGAVSALRQLLPRQWTPERGLGWLEGKLPDVTLLAATDGNHGAALARIASWLGVGCRVYVPESLSAARADRIASEGGEVVRVAGGYDDAVARSAAEGRKPGCVLVSDTSWPGYEATPAAVMAGYSTILRETAEQLSALGQAQPDLVVVQLGVGSFGAAVIGHFASAAGSRARIVGVEPAAAACVMASLAAGRRLTVPGPHRSIAAGLNCGTPSYLAWPVLAGGLEGVVALGDDHSRDGVRALARHGIAAGPCSGIALAAARELLAGPHASLHRGRLRLGAKPQVLLFATDGPPGGSQEAGG